MAQQYTPGEEKGDRPGHPGLPPELQRILDEILDEDREVFEALAKL